MDVGDESGADGAYSKAERDSGDEPSRADPFAGHGARDLKDDVGNIEDREDNIIIVFYELKVFLESRKPCIAYDDE
jgi:hypothetical protein